MDDINQNVAPTGVKVIAFLYGFFGTALFFAMGVISIISAVRILQEFGAGGEIQSNYMAMATTGLIIGVLSIVLAIFSFFIGRGLRKLRRWARVGIIVIQVIEVFYSIYLLINGNFTGIIYLIIALVIVGYMSFSTKVKQTFSSGIN